MNAIEKWMAKNLITCAKDKTARLQRKDCALRFKMAKINPSYLVGWYGAGPPVDLHDCVDCEDGRASLQAVGDANVVVRGNGKTGRRRVWK